MLAAAPAAAAQLDYQVHGFAAQGFAWSQGNDAYGSSRNGSLDLVEAGINGTVDLGHGLLASGQALFRRAGETDRGGLRLDYALLDFRAIDGGDFDAGVRAGRVKNPFGLFNETRDVVFTRPGISLPQSIYFDSSGTRSLLFSSDGAQVYGGWQLGGQYLSLVASRALDFTLDDDQRRGFGDSVPRANPIRIEGLSFARLMSESVSGLWQVGLTYTTAQLNVAPAPGSPLSGMFDFDLYVLSASHRGERYALTAEYQATHSRTESSFFPPSDGWSDGFYVQGDYRLTPQWRALLRYDATFSDRNDRDGSQAEAQTGAPRHSRFAHDWVTGIDWRNATWGVWGEVHFIDGTATVSTADNPQGPGDPHWTLFLLMAAYRF